MQWQIFPKPIWLLPAVKFDSVYKQLLWLVVVSLNDVIRCVCGHLYITLKCKKCSVSGVCSFSKAGIILFSNNCCIQYFNGMVWLVVLYALNIYGRTTGMVCIVPKPNLGISVIYNNKDVFMCAAFWKDNCMQSYKILKEISVCLKLCTLQPAFGLDFLNFFSFHVLLGFLDINKRNLISIF